MGIVLDVIILSVLALSLILGYRKGLIGVAFNLCAFLVALIITWILYTPITNLVINNTQIDDGIRNTIIEKGVIKEKVENEKTEEKIEENDNVVNQYIQKYVTEPATNATNNVVEETAKVVSEKVVAIGVAGVVGTAFIVPTSWLNYISVAYHCHLHGICAFGFTYRNSMNAVGQRCAHKTATTNPQR